MKRILLPKELNAHMLRDPVPKSKIGSAFMLNRVALAGISVDKVGIVKEKVIL